MSTITVTNIKATGETASRAVSGVAGLGINFDGTGTISTRDSVNVASIADNGTGEYTVNNTNNFAKANYFTVVSSSNNGMSNTDSMGNPFGATTSLFKVGTNNNSGTATDRSHIACIITGDLA